MSTKEAAKSRQSNPHHIITERESNKMNKPNRNTVSAGEIYSSILQLVNYAESTTWNRLYNFLMANSILILAWATIYVSQSKTHIKTIVMVAICVIGAISGFFFGLLGIRGRLILKEYIKLGRSIEAKPKFWPIDLQEHKLFTDIERIRDQTHFRWAGSFYILPVGPWTFAVLYIILLYASLEPWMLTVFYIILRCISLTC